MSVKFLGVCVSVCVCVCVCVCAYFCAYVVSVVERLLARGVRARRMGTRLHLEATLFWSLLWLRVAERWEVASLGLLGVQRGCGLQDVAR